MAKIEKKRPDPGKQIEEFIAGAPSDGDPLKSDARKEPKVSEEERAVFPWEEEEFKKYKADLRRDVIVRFTERQVKQMDYLKENTIDYRSRNDFIVQAVDALLKKEISKLKKEEGNWSVSRRERGEVLD